MPLCSIDACDPARRLERIKKKLERDACSQNAVIGLQEVPRSWTGPLFKFFASINYHFLSCGYGQDFNDNMVLYIFLVYLKILLKIKINTFFVY